MKPSLTALFLICVQTLKGQGFPDITPVQDSIDAHVRASVWLDLEQDFLLDFVPGFNQDRNYTQGTALSYQSTELRKSLLFVPLECLEWLRKKMSGGTPLLVLPPVISAGVTAFTPRTIDAPQPVNGDRPFANLVWLSTLRNTFNVRSGWLTQTGLHLGWMGSNVAGVFQSFAHRSLVPGRPTEISWHHQVSRGGSPAFMFSLRSMRSLLQFPRDTACTYRWLDISAGALVQAGWYTGLATPVQIRIGRMGLNSILTADLLSPLANGNRLMRKSASSGKKRDNRPAGENAGFEACLLISVQPRLTPHNSLILGQPGRKDEYVLSAGNYNPLILDLEYGVVLSRVIIRDHTLLPVKRLDLVLSMLSRSSEITGTDFKRWHHWGRISVRLPLGWR